MVQIKKCLCDIKFETEINSLSKLEAIKNYFNEQKENGIYIEEQAKTPYYVYEDVNEHKEYFASKWYICTICGCLWEIEFPDFPAKGFVRKYKDGLYTGKTVVNANETPKKPIKIIHSQNCDNKYYMFSNEIFIHGKNNKVIGLPIERGSICFCDMYYNSDILYVVVNKNKGYVTYILNERDLVMQKI